MSRPDSDGLREAMMRSEERRAIRRESDAVDAEVQLWRQKAVLHAAPHQWVLRVDGDDGALFDKPHTGRRVILSVSRENDGEVWLHASISRRDGALPTYDDLIELHRLFMGGVIAYQLFVPQREHVNLNEVLHLFACLTRRVTPDFTDGTGSI